MASKSSAATARESRRRKILERGADRLAIITGGFHALPAESARDGDSKPPADSSQPSISSHHELSLPHLLSDGVTADKTSSQPPDYLPKQVEEPMLPLYESTGSESVQKGSFGSTFPEEEAAATSDVSGEYSETVQRSHPAQSDQSPAAISVPEQLLQEQVGQRRVVTPSQISSAITASERTRVICSVAIAILVVSLFLGFPVLENSIVKGIFSFRPLYLLLVTNATIVLARVLLNIQRVSEMPSSSSSSYDWAAQASKALEMSFVGKKALDAILVDVSVYATIVVCAFCVLRP